MAAPLATTTVQFHCEPRFTGSYGTLYSFHRAEGHLQSSKGAALKQAWHDLRAFKDMFDVHSDGKPKRLSDRFKDRILEFVATPGVAVKIIKIHLEVHNKRGILAFQEETSKIRMIRKALGDDFEEYTCIRSVSRKGPFSFMLNIRPEHRDRLSFELNIGPDKSFKTFQLFMILQEKGRCDLRTLMRQHPAEVDVAELDSNIAQFMGRLHAASIVHKDIKPANIVYFPQSRVRYKVIDYGLCSSLSDPLQAWKAKGTPGYMSPVFLMANGYSLARIYAQYVNKRIHQNLYGLAAEKYRSAFKAEPMHKNAIMAALARVGTGVVAAAATAAAAAASPEHRQSATWYERHYQLILKKNDEFAYAIILLELQLLLGGVSVGVGGGGAGAAVANLVDGKHPPGAATTLSLKRKLNQLLGYEALYFQGRVRRTRT